MLTLVKKIQKFPAQEFYIYLTLLVLQVHLLLGVIHRKLLTIVYLQDILDHTFYFDFHILGVKEVLFMSLCQLAV